MLNSNSTLFFRILVSDACPLYQIVLELSGRDGLFAGHISEICDIYGYSFPPQAMCGDLWMERVEEMANRIFDRVENQLVRLEEALAGGQCLLQHIQQSHAQFLRLEHSLLSHLDLQKERVRIRRLCHEAIDYFINCEDLFRSCCPSYIQSFLHRRRINSSSPFRHNVLEEIENRFGAKYEFPPVSPLFFSFLSFSLFY